jgi:hypothetical protein
MVAVNTRLYGCAARKDRGPAVCAGLHVPRKILDARLLGIIREDLLSPSAVAEMQAVVAALLAEQRRQSAARAEIARRRAKELEGEIARLVDAVAEMGLSPALRARLQAAETERAALADQSPVKEGKIPDVMPRYRRLLADLGSALSDDIPKAREMLRGYFGEIRLVEEGREVFADLKEEPAALLVACGGLSLGMVAGARFSTQRRIFVFQPSCVQRKSTEAGCFWNRNSG